jgi:hypothetical protein
MRLEVGCPIPHVPERPLMQTPGEQLFVDYDAARALGVLTPALDIGPFQSGDRDSNQAYIADGWLTVTTPIDRRDAIDILQQRGDRLFLPFD